MGQVLFFPNIPYQPEPQDECDHDWRDNITGRTRKCRKCGETDYNPNFLSVDNSTDDSREG